MHNLIIDIGYNLDECFNKEIDKFTSKYSILDSSNITNLTETKDIRTMIKYLYSNYIFIDVSNFKFKNEAVNEFLSKNYLKFIDMDETIVNRAS